MTRLTFGIGGYKGATRRYLASVKSDDDKIKNLAEALRDVGFWTVVTEHRDNEEPTIIEIGEITTQRI